MRTLFLGAFAVLPFLLAGCGADTSDTGPTNDPNVLEFETGSFDAPAGDSFECFYLDSYAAKELSVRGASGQQGPGGHHIIIYWTDVKQAPGHHTCIDSEMVNWHQFAATAGQDSGAEGVIQLEDGLATKVPEGVQFVIQSHYINTTGKTERVNDKIKVNLVEPKDVVHYVNYFVTIDEGFEVPPNGTLKRVTQCTVPRDFDNVLLLGHMHEWASYYSIEHQPADTKKPKSMLYAKKWQPLFASHPPITYYPEDQPLHLDKGDTLVQTCEWNNNTPDPITFPREMCVGFFYYYPDAGEIVCEATPVE